MSDRTVCRVLAAILLAAGAVQAAERPAPARLCPENLPADVHLPPQAGCDVRAPLSDGPAHADGFRDLGNGVSVRMNGRAGAEFGARR